MKNNFSMFVSVPENAVYKPARWLTQYGNVDSKIFADALEKFARKNDFSVENLVAQDNTAAILLWNDFMGWRLILTDLVVR